MGTTAAEARAVEVGDRFSAARRQTLSLCAGLTAEDMMVQSCPEASPAKWHLAHTAWFFESFVLREFLPGYRLFNADFPWLFNSYYESFSAFPEKRLRASFSRPALDEILRYREHVDAALSDCSKPMRKPEALQADRAGREPRGAAPGTAADRHPACVFYQSAAAGLRGRELWIPRLQIRPVGS